MVKPVSGFFAVLARQRKEFPKWFKHRMTQLRNQWSPETTDELWSLANGPLPIVKLYSTCISNGIRFHSLERDSRRKTQNSGLVVVGDHGEQSINFFAQLCKVWELTYLFRHRVVLFECEWFNTGDKKTFRVDANCTSIDVRSRWYKDDPLCYRVKSNKCSTLMILLIVVAIGKFYKNSNIEGFGMCQRWRIQNWMMVKILMS